MTALLPRRRTVAAAAAVPPRACTSPCALGVSGARVASPESWCQRIGEPAVPGSHALQLMLSLSAKQAMAPTTNIVTLREIVADLRTLTEEWEEFLKRHEAVQNELAATKDQLQKGSAELATRKTEHDRLLHHQDEGLEILGDLLARYRTERSRSQDYGFRS